MSQVRILPLEAMEAIISHNENIRKLIRDDLSEIDGPKWNTELFHEVFSDKQGKPLLFVMFNRNVDTMEFLMRINILDESVNRFVIKEFGEESLNEGLYYKQVIYENLGWDNVGALENALDCFYSFMAGLNLFLRMEKRKPLDS